MWNYFLPKENSWYQWRLDGGRAFLRKHGEEWRIAFIPGGYNELVSDSGGPEPVEQPGAPAVSIVVGNGKKVALRPHFAINPYVITIRNEVRLLPGAEARFTVALPPLLRFELENGTILAEKQLFSLSPTWFGDKESGTLCLSLPLLLDPQCKGEVETLEHTDNNTSVHTISQFGKYKSLIHCDILVRNSSKDELDLKQFAIFTNLMNIYEQDGMLMSDTVLIDTTNDGGLKMSAQEGPHKGWKKIHAGNKAGLSEVFIRRGINFLKVITGM